MLIELKLNASTSESFENFPIEYLSHIKNDGMQDVYVGLCPLDTDNSGNYHTYVTLKPGETVGGMKVKTNRIFYKSAEGTQPIRAAGLSVYGGE